jgi:hypothetical protein
VTFTRPARLQRWHVRQGFSSGAEELGEWLVEHSRQNQRARNATTYVTTDGQRVVGYYAITVAGLAKAEVPKAFAKQAPRQFGCLLLARMAVDVPVQPVQSPRRRDVGRVSTNAADGETVEQ